MAFFHLSDNAVNHLNDGRKRKINFCQWNRNSQKLARVQGQVVISHNEIVKQAKLGPSLNRVCGVKCKKSGCQLSYDHRKVFFDSYRKLTSNDEQSLFLLRFVRYEEVHRRRPDIENSRRNITMQYFILGESGKQLPVCISTFLDTLDISRARVRYLMNRVRSGDPVPVDMRGKHQNHPKVNAEVVDSILNHIASIPTVTSHYSRQNGDPERKYIASTWSIAKLYRDLAQQKTWQNDQFKDLYYRKFHESGIHIAQPMSDTCGRCDMDHIELKRLEAAIPRDDPAIYALKNSIEVHQAQAQKGYDTLKQDVQTSQQNQNFVVISVDMQANISIPKLPHGKCHFQTKFSCYNLGIHRPSTDEMLCYFWDQTKGKKGACEIASCIVHYVRSAFDILDDGAERTLIVWSDRCTGQNNNFETIVVYRYLVTMGYFTKIEQKFLVTGHSYQTCDRKFATIEKSLRKSILHTPGDVMNAIREARPSNPFQVIEMHGKILDFDPLKAAIRRPRDLRVTRCLNLKVDKLRPGILAGRASYDDDWHDYQMPVNQGINEIQLQSKYHELFPLKDDLKKDLTDMLNYMPMEPRRVWMGILNLQ